ncbi:MAG: 4-hydroxy-3-methylbut-2-enyl diphosphate reductase [Chloroflexi bacterium]|nr:4-hydroxy-3-methylbut-2-enyl diphosphate reductase [Chloroflexota bacterium]
MKSMERTGHMQIVLAKEMGFCFGVRRAVELASRASGGGAVATLGALVHNAQVVRHLEDRGIRVADELSQIASGTLVIASHGAAPAVTQAAEARGLSVVDATCPMVRATQRKAERLANEGFTVIVFGDPHHAEVRGILGWGQGRATVVSRVEELATLPRARRIALLAQSTHSAEAYQAIAQRLLEQRMADCIEIRVYNTICDATAKRQAAAAGLAHEVEVIIVVGGRDSANTRRLAEICTREGAIAHQIEEAAELDPAWVAGRIRVGVTAGASTPDWVVQEVIEALQRLGGELCAE